MIGGYVYVMTNGGGMVKIGSTNNLKSRLSMLRCGDRTIEVVFSSPVLSNRIDVERSAAKLVEDSVFDGEWFNCSVDEAVSSVESAVDTIGLLMVDGQEFDKGRFDSVLKDRTDQATGILSGIYFDDYPEIVSTYVDYLQANKPEYLKVFCKKQRSEMFLLASAALASAFIHNQGKLEF